MSSMLSPASRCFSMSTSRFTPSTTICTNSTSEKPRRSALEMSKTPPTAAVSTPPETHREKVMNEEVRDRCSFLFAVRMFDNQ
uniref:Uncharacterized protein n=1 Tax=Amphilophus citrinellus TaxID=61819 RepID=A0A3Q0RM96_AMPCI